MKTNLSNVNLLCQKRQAVFLALATLTLLALMSWPTIGLAESCSGRLGGGNIDPSSSCTDNVAQYVRASQTNNNNQGNDTSNTEGGHPGSIAGTTTGSQTGGGSKDGSGGTSKFARICVDPSFPDGWIITNPYDSGDSNYRIELDVIDNPEVLRLADDAISPQICYSSNSEKFNPKNIAVTVPALMVPDQLPSATLGAKATEEARALLADTVGLQSIRGTDQVVTASLPLADAGEIQSLPEFQPEVKEPGKEEHKEDPRDRDDRKDRDTRTTGGDNVKEEVRR